jgi:DNA invertase Pin-like site-specific DNA recombinase
MSLVDAIRRGEVQRVLLWSIDRVGRSLTELVTFLETCRTAGVSSWVDDQKLDTETGNGRSLFDVGGMLACHLRQGRRDRILRGQQAARAASVTFGRPRLTAIKPAKVQRAKEALAAGTPLRKVGRMTGISPASISPLKSSLEQPAAAI